MNEDYALRAWLNIELKVLAMYYEYRHLTYSDFLDEVLSGRIPLKG